MDWRRPLVSFVVTVLLVAPAWHDCLDLLPALALLIAAFVALVIGARRLAQTRSAAVLAAAAAAAPPASLAPSPFKVRPTESYDIGFNPLPAPGVVRAGAGHGKKAAGSGAGGAAALQAAAALAGEKAAGAAADNGFGLRDDGTGAALVQDREVVSDATYLETLAALRRSCGRAQGRLHEYVKRGRCRCCYYYRWYCYYSY